MARHLVCIKHRKYQEESEMRNKILIMSLLVVALAAGSAYAQGGFGGAEGYGPGQGMMGYGGKGPGKMMGFGGGKGAGRGLPADFEPVTQVKADEIAADFISDNLKGYDVVSSEKFQGKRFEAFAYKVADANGNQFNVVVNARGIVRGPFPVKQ